jgi:hypothetical protein
MGEKLFWGLEPSYGSKLEPIDDGAINGGPVNRLASITDESGPEIKSRSTAFRIENADAQAITQRRGLFPHFPDGDNKN